MRKMMIAAVCGAALLSATPAFALCTNAAGTVGGAATGAVAGAVVGGPVGAAVGGVVGGAVGSQALPPTSCSYVLQDDVPPVTIQKQVVVGEPLPQRVTLYPIPQTQTYVFANVNQHRVIVNPRTRVVVEVVD